MTALMSGCTTVATSQGDVGTGLVYEHQAMGIDAPDYPVPDPSFGLVALGGTHRPFFRVHPSFLIARPMVLGCTCTPVVTAKRAQCSSRKAAGYAVNCAQRTSCCSGRMVAGRPGMGLGSYRHDHRCGCGTCTLERRCEPADARAEYCSNRVSFRCWGACERAALNTPILQRAVISERAHNHRRWKPGLPLCRYGDACHSANNGAAADHRLHNAISLYMHVHSDGAWSLHSESLADCEPA